MSLVSLAWRLVRDEDGQDLVEYAMLATFVGVACAAAWGVVRGAIATGFVGWDTAEQNLWRPPNP